MNVALARGGHDINALFQHFFSGADPMVAIVAGNGLGLFNMSSSILGSGGILGQGWMGQAGGRSYVNAATGNLILQFQDEQLAGRGADLLHLRTYNSLGKENGQFTDGDVDGWRWDGERKLVLSGTVNTVGSTVTRTGGDGSATTFTWNGSRYVTTDGAGAHDTLEYSAGAAADLRWKYTEGTTRLVEHYGTTATGTVWRLAHQTDTSGNVIDYAYNNDTGLLLSVTDRGSGQFIELTYGENSAKLSQVKTHALIGGTVGAAVKQVEYIYDAGRLKTVKTVLNPGDATETFYTTTYNYDGATTRISSIVQGDGTRVDFTYDGQDRILTVEDASGKQTFSYVSATQTNISFDVGDGSPKVWSFFYDDSKRLTQIKSPPPVAGDAQLVTTFHYDASGNVDEIIDARGFKVVYEYNAQGSRTRERDAEGNTITRTYNSNNQVLTETRYRVGDPDGAGTGQPSEPMTTRFVYDASSRLRFVISAEGRVSENRYGTGTADAGLLVRTIQYAGARYDATPFSLSDLTNWAVNLTDKTQAQQTQYEYDFRGDLSKRTDFATIGTNGVGTLDAAATVTEYIYDPHGRLLKTIAVRGSNRDQRAELTVFTYDGMGRERSRTNSSGTRTTATAYDGTNKTITVTTNVTDETSRIETRAFDDRGRLLSVTQAAGEIARPTRYVYDTAGQLRMKVDVLGGRHFSFYDAAGRVLYQVGSGGAVTGFEYNATGQLIKQTRYANAATNIGSWVNEATQAVKHTLTVGAAGSDVETNTANDRVTEYEYDKAGRLTKQTEVTEAANIVTKTNYDGASRITDRTTGDRITRFFYDTDGRLVGTVDPLGYLTENKFDAAGRLVETVRYHTRSPSAGNVAAPVLVGVANQAAVGGRLFEYHIPAFDADGDELEFSKVGSWPDWLTLVSDPSGATLRGTPPTTLTSYDVVLSVSDGRDKSSNVSLRITVSNSAPSWDRLADRSVPTHTAGFTLTLPEASDVETAAANLVYSIPSGLPPGLQLNGRTISGTPTTAGTYVITARVADGTGQHALYTDRTFVLQITNKGATWPAVSNPVRFVNTALTFTVPAATDPEAQTLTYAVISKPSWLQFNAANRIFTGTPPQLGLHTVVLEATDSFGETTRLSFSFDIQNRAPTWAALTSPPWTAGSPVDYLPPAAVDPDGEGISYADVSHLYAQVNGLPPGLVVNSSTGRITGTSNAVGTFTVILRATDARGAFVERTLSLVLNNAPPVYVHGIDDVAVLGNANVSITLPADAFIDPNGDALSPMFAVTPDWLEFDSGSRTFTGQAPNVSQSWGVTVIVSDFVNGGNAHRNFAIIVTQTGGGGGGGGPRPPGPPVDQQSAPGGGVPITPITPAPAPVLVPIEPAPAPLTGQAALPPRVDVLSSWRPATHEKDLHSYQYYDAQGRTVGSVDERGFLTERVYDAHTNKELTRRYETALTVSDSDSLGDLKGRAGPVQTSTVEYNAMGLVLKRIDVHGTVTRYEYDSLDRLVREVRAFETSEARASRTRYNDFDEVTGTVGGEGDASGLSTDDAIAQYGTRYEYDSEGRRTKTIDARGNVTLLFYDREGQLTHTINAKGEVSETVYNRFGQVQSTRRYAKRIAAEIMTANPPPQWLRGGFASNLLLEEVAKLAVSGQDRLTTYDYDQRGLLSTTTDGEGFATTNTYNAFGQLATQIRTILQGAGSKTTTTQFDYDLRGALLSTTADVGGVNFNTQTAYDAFGRVIKSIDAAGKVTTTDYTNDGREIEVTLQVNGADRKVRTVYDAFARVLRQIDASGKETVYAYNKEARSVSVTTPEGVTVTTTQTRHGETLNVVDGRNNTTSYEYNKDGQLRKVIDALGRAVTENEYATSGLLSQTKDARGVVTTFAYDAVNRMFERRVDPSGLNLVTTYQFNGFGEHLRVTEGVGNNAGANITRVTDYKYDRNGRLTQTIVDPGTLKLTTTYEYDGLGNTIRVARGNLGNLDQHVTLYEFDKLGRRVKEIAAPSKEIATPSVVFGAGSARERDLTTEYRYDAAGRVSRKIDALGQSTWFVYDAAGELTHTVNAEGEVNQSFYDVNGRVVRTHRYAARLSAGTLAGLGDVASANTVTPAVNGTDQRSYFVYDKDGRPRYTLQNLIDKWSISESRYDKNSNLIETRRYDKALTDARIVAMTSDGQILDLITVEEMAGELLTTLGYDDATAGTLAKIQRTRFAYDANNRLRFTVDALGSVSENAYDKAGNVIAKIRYATQPGLTAYDESTIDAAVNRANTANQVSRFVYDTAGRQAYGVRVSGFNGSNQPLHVVSKQVYDALGRVVQSITYANAMTLADYEQATLDSAVVANKSVQDRRSAFAYDAAGHQVYSMRVAEINGEGVATKHLVSKREYDPLGQVISSTDYATLITATLSNYGRATLDTAVAAIVNATHDRTTTFIYDKAGRQRFVVAADGSLSETLYDALGQVTERRQLDFTLSTAISRTEQALVGRRAARAVGDGVTRGEKYTYDRAGRVLTTTDAKNFVQTYGYDALGNRTSFINRNGDEWTYTYDRLGQLRTEVSPEVAVQLSDGTKSARKLTTLREYDAFGNLTKRTEANGTIDARTTSYDYDTLGRLELTTLPGFYDPQAGKVEKVTATGRFQRSIQVIYDALGNSVRTKTRIATGTAASSFLDEYKTYDALGRVVHHVDALKHVTGFTYNAFSEQLTVTRNSVTVSGAPGNANFWLASEIAGKVSSDNAARTIVMKYDNLGRKTEVTQPALARYYRTGEQPGAVPATVAPPDAPPSPVTKYEYNVFGEIQRESTRISADDRWRDTWHYFDTRGREIRTIDTLGHHTAHAYDALGNLKETVEFATAGSAGSSALAPPAMPAESSKDRITAFTYDALGRRETIQRKNLTFTQWNGSEYVQVNAGRPVAKTVASMTYDNEGRVKTQTDVLGNVTRTEYNELGQVTKVTEPARVTAGTGVDPFLNQVQRSPMTILTLNAFGQVVTQERSPGGSGESLFTVNEYDFAGNLLRTSDPNRSVINFNNGTLVTDHTYDKVRQYDFAGRVIKETQAINVTLGDWLRPNRTVGNWQNVSHTLERRYAYDASGRQTHALDVFMEGTTLKQSGQRSVFNAFGDVTEERRVAGTASAALGNLTEITTATYDYDKGGRLITRQAVEGRTEYFYDLTGQVTRQEQRDNKASNDGSGGLVPTRITETFYDDLGRARLRRLPSFDALLASGSSRVTPTMEQQYDRWGNVISRGQGRFYNNATGAVVNSEQRITQYEYNHDNKVILEMLPQVKVVRANGTDYQAKLIHGLRYDVLGRVVEEFDAADDVATVVNEALTALRTRSKEYNEVGQLIAQTDATEHRTSYVYDAHGNRVGTKNALGVVLVDTFDKNGNLTSHGIVRGAAVKVLNRYQYDQANRRVATEEITDQFIVGSLVSNWTFAQYDERNFVRSTFSIRALPVVGDALTLDPGRVSSVCVYDAFGHKTSETDVLQNTRTWAYNTTAGLNFNFGQLTSATVGGRTTQYAYNDLGQLKSETYSGTGISSAQGKVTDRVYLYHDNGLLKQLTDRGVYGTLGMAGGADYVETRDDTIYHYTVHGERSKEEYTRTGTMENGQYTYNEQTGEFDTSAVFQLVDIPLVTRHTVTTYDVLGRLATVTTPVVGHGRSQLTKLTHEYDELGNRRHIKADYSPTGAGPTTSDRWYTYDDEGRMEIVDGVLDEDRHQIELGDSGTRITYDALGRRETTEKRVDLFGLTGATLPPDSPPWMHHSPDMDPDETKIGHEYREELYIYNDQNFLVEIRQRANLRDIKYQRNPNPPPAAPNRDDEIGTWVPSETRSPDVQGRVSNSSQYSVVRLGNNGNQTAPVLARTVNSEYDDRGFMSHQTNVQWRRKANGEDERRGSSEVYNDFDDSGVLRSYAYEQYGYVNGVRNATYDFRNKYDYDYRMEFGGYKESRVTLTSTLPDDADGVTLNDYDARGNLIRQTVANSLGARNRLFAYNAEGQITVKDESLIKPDGVSPLGERGAEEHFYVAGRQVGTIGSGKLFAASQFNYNYTPISAAYPATSPGSYTVNDGDTLASIAQAVFGDSSLWYLIADANSLGFGPNDALPSVEIGKSYRIPNVVTSVHNDATTFRPYNPAHIIGDSTPLPGIPAPPATACAIQVARVLAVAVVVAAAAFVTAYTGGMASYAMGAVLGEGLAATAVGAGIGAAAGSAVSQLGMIGVTGGKLSDFSGKRVLASGLSGAFGGIAKNALSGLANSGGLLGTLTSETGNYLSDEIANQLVGLDTPSFGAAVKQIGINSLHNLPGSGTFTKDVGVNAGVNAGLNDVSSPSFDWRGALAQVAYSVINPDTGWFTNRSGDWTNIASSVLNPFAGELGGRIGGRLSGSTIDSIKEARRGTAPNTQRGVFADAAQEAPNDVFKASRIITGIDYIDEVLSAKMMIAMNQAIINDNPGLGLRLGRSGHLLGPNEVEPNEYVLTVAPEPDDKPWYSWVGDRLGAFGSGVYAALHDFTWGDPRTGHSRAGNFAESWEKHGPKLERLLRDDPARYVYWANHGARPEDIGHYDSFQSWIGDAPIVGLLGRAFMTGAKMREQIDAGQNTAAVDTLLNFAGSQTPGFAVGYGLGKVANSRGRSSDTPTATRVASDSTEFAVPPGMSWQGVGNGVDVLKPQRLLTAGPGLTDPLGISPSGRTTGYHSSIPRVPSGGYQLSAADLPLGLSVGKRLGNGAFKEVHEYGDDLAVAVSRDAGGGRMMRKELAYLTALEGVPGMQGHVLKPLSDVFLAGGRPAYLMHRYAQGSKEYESLPSLERPSYVNKQSVVDLLHIGKTLQRNHMDVWDFQGLFARDGRFVVSDPIGLGYGVGIDKVTDAGEATGELLRKILGTYEIPVPPNVQRPLPPSWAPRTW